MIYLTERITVDKDLCNGKPTIRGLRITVKVVLDYLAAGNSISEILDNYPELSQQDIEACLDFASRIIDQNIVIKPFAA